MNAKTTLTVLIAALMFSITNYGGCAVNGLLFPDNLAEAKYIQFRAEGYKGPVAGIIYRNNPLPPSGVPMGGVDTGGIDIDASGNFGYTSMFNHYVPQGGPVNQPFLGISVGGTTWVMTTGKTKQYWVSGVKPDATPDLELKGTQKATAIDYWGHYPVADLQYHTDCPVTVAMRAWSPLIPGDVKVSNTPGCVFSVRIKNAGSSTQKGTLAFSFPGFADHGTKTTNRTWQGMTIEPIMPEQKISRELLDGKLKGVYVADSAWGMSYVLATAQKSVRRGLGLGTDGARWAAIAQQLPADGKEDGGSSLAVEFKLAPGESKTVDFVLAWYAPVFEGTGLPGTTYKNNSKKFTHMYASRFADAKAVAEFLNDNRKTLLNRVIRWQSAIYDDKAMPAWLRDTLTNSLYYFPKTSFWAQKAANIGDWCRKEDGLFAMDEAPRSCPNVSTLSNIAIAGPTLSYVFPELQLALLRAYKAYQRPDGDLPGILGQNLDATAPQAYGYQDVMAFPNYITQLSCYYKATGDKEFVKEFYPSAKKAIEFAMTQRPDLGDTQIVAMPLPAEGRMNTIEWYEDKGYRGYVTHPGGFRLAAAEIVKEWAKLLGDTDEEQRLTRIIAAGKEAMQKHLWAKTHYIVWQEPTTNEALDAFFSPSLNGQFFARQHGVPGVFPKANIDVVLQQMKKACTISKLGIPPIWANPDATIWTSDTTGYLCGQYIYLYKQAMFNGMTYIYEGQKEFGLDLMRRTQETFSGKWAYTWDSPNSFSGAGDTGEMTYGWDYWFNWTIWSAVSALDNKDVSAPCQTGGLVAKMLKAGKKR
ncbi:MAG: GH116 family glycosyl-hydrolase [Armatimonadota bacterium]